MDKGDSVSISSFLTSHRSNLIQSLLMALFSQAFDRADVRTMNVLIENRSPSCLDEALSLEHLNKDEEALRLYQEALSLMDEKMEQEYLQLVLICQSVSPLLAGKYRVMARLSLNSNDYDSFFLLVDQAWDLHVLAHNNGECDHLLWTKGIMLQRLGRDEDALSTFNSLVVSTSSPLYASLGLSGLGLHREALSRLKEEVTSPSKVKGLLSVAQLSRCLMALMDVSIEAIGVYRRLRKMVDADMHHFKSQSALDIQFVKQVCSKVTAFLKHLPNDQSLRGTRTSALMRLSII
eukprot:TRINITY_DN16419_c0_g1_i1.p1 TRINITY_DN16419_c0_g1~~TRINITY_DN16419_c0_g1_i1.p1  ORF type:complete len:292 (+),score=51.81 TRINITY_DN16419_c0_g1_i1:930-1805(+)